MIQQSHSWAYTQTKLSFKKIHAPLCSQQQCSQQPRCGATYMFITRGMDNKMRCVYTKDYYSVIKKNKIMPPTATWMQSEIIMLSKACQKDKYHVISLICGM